MGWSPLPPPPVQRGALVCVEQMDAADVTVLRRAAMREVGDLMVYTRMLHNNLNLRFEPAEVLALCRKLEKSLGAVKATVWIDG